MLTFRWGIGGLFVLMLACQTKPKQEKDATSAATTTEAPVDSAKALATRPGPDAPRLAADRLIRALYFEHNKSENPFREKKDRSVVDQFFVKSVADQIWDGSQKATGKIDRSAINLLFNAPDKSIHKTWVEPAAVGGSKAVVYVTFLNNAKPEEVRIELNQQPDKRWRIANMIYPGGKQLAELLR